MAGNWVVMMAGSRAEKKAGLKVDLMAYMMVDNSVDNLAASWVVLSVGMMVDRMVVHLEFL